MLLCPQKWFFLNESQFPKSIFLTETRMNILSGYDMMSGFQAKFCNVIITIFLYGSTKLIVEATCNGPSTSKFQDTLVFAHVFFRHGDRSPLFDFPNNKINISEKWPTGLGQITPKGKMQGYQLGEFLRRRYNSLIRDFYHPEDIYMLSSDYGRTTVTALTVLAGLYPVKEKWHSSLNWDPIHTSTIPHELDNIIAFASPCPRYKEELDCYRYHGKGRKLDVENQKFYAYLANHTGIPLSQMNFEKVSDVFDTLYVQDSNNFGVPDWAKTRAYEGQEDRLMRKLSERTFSALTDNAVTMKLRGMPLLKEIIRNLESHILPSAKGNKNIAKFKLRLYSGHDTTIASLLQIFSIYNEELVPYTGAVMIELYKRSYPGNSSSLMSNNISSSCSSTAYFIKFFYRNCTTQNVPIELTLPDCQDVTESPDPGVNFKPGCSVGKLKEVKAHILKGDWHKLCKNGKGCCIHCMNFRQEGNYSNFENKFSVSGAINWMRGCW